MSMQEWIERKRDGLALSGQEIGAFVAGLVSGEIPDYQAAAFLMAAYLRGMDEAETAALTSAMLRSGAVLDLSTIGGAKVDKHSTGGVGDKVSLVLAPAVAACGGRVPMISGRSLGHTGGTLDKLESIPGFRVGLTLDELCAQVGDLGAAFGAATADLAPADRLLYRLRDATATVASIPLITSSILAKKAAEGIDGLVLDVKTGNGAFMATPRAARDLARSLVSTAERLGLRAVALITDMSQPLGAAIGNSVEVVEAVEALKGGGPRDLVELVTRLGAEMLLLAGLVPDLRSGCDQIARSLADGSALARFRAIVERQGGDASAIEDVSRLPCASRREPLESPASGHVQSIDCRALGAAACALGAGRRRMEDAIDHGVGLICMKKVGDAVVAGEPLLLVLYNDAARYAAVRPALQAAFVIGEKRPSARPLVRARLAGAGCRERS
ncbi:MAG: thymidine phosphorylase [Planctomycetes bacterium]|nr:thymidine phosphorylase [Planctomycetota bacterium]